MIKLNLITKNKEQEILKEYLENNVSEFIANKINNGVKITKDNKTLLNKKDLDGFIKFATEEAKKRAEKGATSACIEDKVVFGWAMHYFEEDSIEGTLYNEDGSTYQQIKKTTTKPIIPKVEPQKEKPKQSTLFDLFDNIPKENTIIDNEPDPLFDDEEEIEIKQNITEFQEKTQINEEKSKKIAKISDFYEKYHEQEMSYPDIIVLIKLGDFYEAYNENAERIADILDLTLTSKDVGLKHKVKLAGFPVHVKDSYFKRLNEKSPLVVIENDEIKFVDNKKEEIQPQTDRIQTFDKYLLKSISSILDGKVVIK